MQSEFTTQQIIDILSEVRVEISRVNRGGVIFNPAATQLLDALIGDLCVGEAA